MPVDFIIADPTTGKEAAVETVDKNNGLVVATIPLKTYNSRHQFFMNDTYAADMNQDASTGGTPENIHNGEDDTYWEGAQIAGGSDIDVNSTNQAHAGTQSVYFNRCEVGDEVEFAKGSYIDLTGYNSLTLWVYIDSNLNDNDSFQMYWYDRVRGQTASEIVLLQDYMDINILGAWQKVTIPIDDMLGRDYGDIDALRIRCAVIDGIKPRFYIDDIELQETGGVIKFSVKPRTGKNFYVDRLMINYADEYAGTVSDGTMPSIPYNGFFGVSKLTNGILYQRWQDGSVNNANLIKQHIDLMSFSNAEVTGCGSDGTNSWCTIVINFPATVKLNADDEDELRLSVNDDLSGLLLLRICAGGYEEDIP